MFARPGIRAPSVLPRSPLSHWRSTGSTGSSRRCLSRILWILAKAGLRTTVFEAQPTIGGGARSAELTLPGFVHDVCSAVHPWAVSSPAFAAFPLAEHGLDWIQPPLPLAHPLDDGSAAVLAMPLQETCAHLGTDGAAYRRAIAPLVRRWRDLVLMIQAPLLRMPAHPWLLARFGALAFWPAAPLARRLFRTEAARALFAGNAAHSVLPLDALGSAAFGWVLAAAGHAVGWPIPRGGSQAIANALASYFESLGGRIVTNSRIQSLDELEDASFGLCDVTPPPIRGYRRQPFAGPLQPPIGGLPLWSRRFQSRLGLERAYPVEGSRVRPRRHGPRGRIARRDRGLRAHARRDNPERSPVRARRAAQPVRLHPRARRPAHGLGVLPRATRLHGGHDRPHRIPGGALRARLPRAHCGAPHYDPRRPGTARRQPGGRRYHRRRARSPATRAAAYAPALSHAARWRVSVLLIHAARRSRARHVRLSRSARGSTRAEPGIDAYRTRFDASYKGEAFPTLGDRRRSSVRAVPK